MIHFKLTRLREDVPAILKLAIPILVGQLAVIAFGVLDTAMTARYSAEDLAALAMASAIFISIYVGLTGIVSALPLLLANSLVLSAPMKLVKRFARLHGWPSL